MKFWHLAVIFLVINLLALWSLTPTNRVSAHANQVASSPESGARLESSPERIVIWFSEPISENFSAINLLDASGKQVNTATARLDPTENTALILPLPELNDGTYVAVWNNLSEVDGHKVYGSFAFAVGEEVNLTDITLPSQPLLQYWADPWIRSILFMGIITGVGAIFFEFFVMLPAFRQVQSRSPLQQSRLLIWEKFLIGVVYLAISGFVVATAAHILTLVQQVYLTELSLQESRGFVSMIQSAWTLVSDTSWGRLWAVRLAAIVIAPLLLILGYRSARQYEEFTFPTDTLLGTLGLVTGIGLLFVSALTSHNAASPEDVRTPATITDFIHLIGASGWVGGIVSLLLGATVAVRKSGIKQMSEVLTPIVSKFTPFAMLCAITLVISGTVSSWIQVTVIPAFGTPYGGVLIAKIVLVCALVGFGFINSFVVKKRLPKSGNWVLRIAVAETVVAFFVIVAVGWLAGLEPARQYAGRNGIGVPDSATYTAEDRGLNVSLEVTPGRTGLNTVTATPVDDSGNPSANILDIRAKVKYLEQELGEPTFSLKQVSPGVWASSDYFIPLAGEHQLEITVLRQRSFDSFFAFRFNALSTQVYRDIITPDGDIAWILLGAQIAVIGVAIVTIGLAYPNVANRFRYKAATGALLLLGVLLISNNFTVRAGLPDDFSNPIPITSQSVMEGGGSYASYCSRCHGAIGKGDGAISDTLVVPPADLTVHIPLHKDSDLYTFIHDGIVESGMPAHGDILSDDEIWHLVNFLRTLVNTEEETVKSSP